MKKNQKSVPAAFFLACLLTIAPFGCGQKEGGSTSPQPARAEVKKGPEPQEKTDPRTRPRQAGVEAAGVEAAAKKKPDVDYRELLKILKKVRPNVASYRVSPDLSNVLNAKNLKKALSPDHRKYLAKNGFVVTPTDYIQMFHVYENNEYIRPDRFGAFITTDSMLHTFHLFFDYALRTLESEKLFRIVSDLTDGMIEASRAQAGRAGDIRIRNAALRNTAFFSVARALLTGKGPDKGTGKRPDKGNGKGTEKGNGDKLGKGLGDKLGKGLGDKPDGLDAKHKAMVTADLASIRAHGGRATSKVLGGKIDFSQFVPRGHYTRSERLKRYFMAMIWYGLASFPIKGRSGRDEPLLQSLLMVEALGSGKHKKVPLAALWDRVYEPTTFFVGEADDFTFKDYADAMSRVWGKNAGLASLADRSRLKAFRLLMAKRSKAKIHVALIGIDQGEGFRFMGQRFIPDSRIMQEMTHPKVKKRFMPKGLDVLSAMGSDRALHILRKVYKENRYNGFERQMAEMRKEMKSTALSTWMSNLYWGWLWLIKTVAEKVKKGYPMFMQNEAWQDKSLLTALGSWTELRHDTILYAKQSGTECGGDEEKETQKPKGYVEPNVHFWIRLKWLARHTRNGLSSRKLLGEKLADKFTRLEEWVEFCLRISVKELTSSRVTDAEFEKMRYYGAELEVLFKDFAGGDVIAEDDKDMAVVADVHTSYGSALMEGTGRAGAVFVVVPIQGKLYLTRGATYTQYEFRHPASDRLTNAKWRKMLKEGKAPDLAGWTRSFFAKKGKIPPKKFSRYEGGC